MLIQDLHPLQKSCKKYILGLAIRIRIKNPKSAHLLHNFWTQNPNPKLKFRIPIVKCGNKKKKIVFDCFLSTTKMLGS